MFRRGRTAIGLMVAIIMLAQDHGSLSQNAATSRRPSEQELLVMRFSPGKWYHGIKGDVRSIETTQYREVKKGGRVVEAPIKSETTYFDRRGFEIERIEGDESKIIWKHDAQGKVIEMSILLGGAPFSRTIYSYDLRQRKVTSETYLFGSDKLQSREVSIFDEKWNEIRKENEDFGEDGKPTQPQKHVVVYKSIYDEKGRAVISTIGGEDGSISYRFTSEYNDSNYMVKGVNHQYDQSSGTLLSRSVSTYDGKGHLLTYLYYDPRGRLLRREDYTREFDAEGNWIMEKQVSSIYDEGRPGSFAIIKRRKITFY